MVSKFQSFVKDYRDERLVYSNDDISVTKGGTYINNTPIKRPDFSLFNDITYVYIQLESNGR